MALANILFPYAACASNFALADPQGNPHPMRCSSTDRIIGKMPQYSYHRPYRMWIML